jgi:type VI secretion system protein ImpL
MNRQFKLDLLGTILLVVLPGLLVWERPEWVHLSAEDRGVAIAVLCVIFVALQLIFSFNDSSRAAVAWRAVRQWVHDRSHRTLSTSADISLTAIQNRAATLLQVLRDRHGWRWRYRERWVLVAGDEQWVKRLEPSLIDDGYALTNDAVLLYAQQTGDTLDKAWLDQIRRLRRRRPVDAIVAVVPNRESTGAACDVDNISHRLARHARALRWAAPAYLLNVTDFDQDCSSPDEAIGFTWSDAHANANYLDSSLQTLCYNLADAGVVRVTQDARDRYPAELSQHIDHLRGTLSDLVLKTSRSSRSWRHAVHGLLFAPLYTKAELTELARSSSGDASKNDGALRHRHRTTWKTIAEHSRALHGRRVGFSLSTTSAWGATALIGCWVAGTITSGLINRATIRSATDTATQLAAVQDPTQSMRILDSFDKQIDTLEVHRREGAPWSARFGLNRDRALLDALWPRYIDAASRILVAPMRQKLEDRLRQLASMSDAEIASGGHAQVQAAYDTLKAYLMLANPERAIAGFLTPHLIATSVPIRPADPSVSSGTWDDLRQHAIGFFAQHLVNRASTNGSSLAIVPDSNLIASARQTITGVRGIQNSTDALYEQIVDEAKAKYPPVSLTTLLGDTTSRGLFNTTATVPGVFTRAAWDERISKAIDDASEQHNAAGDWVLRPEGSALGVRPEGNAPAPGSTPNLNANANAGSSKTTHSARSTLKAQLRQRYFDDYARAWALFLNSLHWQAEPTLSATADQLTLLGDPQRSPLVALMNAIVYQAGAGASGQSLSGALISKAQRLVGTDEKDPSKQTQPQLAPLATAFGPILRLTGSNLLSGAPAHGKAPAQLAATGDLSLARYLERVTAMRLKASQIVANADPDAMARLAAQAVLQGKTSDIADSREYGSRLAASLGEQWSGFGDLFRAPFDQAWQVVVQPAASSLNEMWRMAIVADWNKAFAGRYPFADSENEASLPEMARFMRPDNGVITQFVTTQLAGVVERQGDRWVAAQGANHGALTIDPQFLASLNQLTRISTVLFPSGDAQVRYELQAVPTPGVTDMKFVLSGRELHYFNQKQAWLPFEWPGQSLENRSHLEWQTQQGGLRTAFDAQGRFGLIRLLERAKVEQQDSARYLLTWTPDTTQGIALKVQLRSEAGAGPLDALQLRHFSLPTRVFASRAAHDAHSAHGAHVAQAGNPPNMEPKRLAMQPPPLPASAIAAAKHAVVPLPQGVFAEVE